MHDFRSDTVTRPTPEMMAAINGAEVGDSSRGDDPTHSRLEAVAAELTGKEAALFLPSGIMCNLAAVLAHTRPGDEIIVEERAHILTSEVGGISAVAGAIPRVLKGVDGILQPADIINAIRPQTVRNYSPTGRICLENTLNAAGGIVVPPAVLQAIGEISADRAVPLHIDGARLFNAAVHLKTSVQSICAGADSVMFALSKGLGAPMGSMLTGSREFIDRARKKARMLGGGMRQSGMMAAAALVALEDPFPQLQRDHEMAAALGAGLARLDDSLGRGEVQTNIVNCFVDRLAVSTEDFVAGLRECGILVNFAGTKVRFVTHRHIDENAVAACVEATEKVLGQLRKVA
jgi:threonine aldolase